MKNFFMLFLTSGLLMLAVGCGTAESEAAPEIAQPQAEQNDTGGVIAVSQVGQCDFLSGMPAMITVSVRNVGDCNVDLPKWFLRDADNLIFHYIKCDENGNIPANAKPGDWTVQTPVIKEPVYYPLTLMPGNSVLLRAELTFVEKLPPDTPTAKYAVVAELNQPRIKLASPPAIITVFQ